MLRRLAQFALLASLVCALAPRASASYVNVYIAQSTAGGNTGADCNDAFAATFFNAAGSWGAGATQIGPGTTVHLCGTISSTLVVQGSGTAGNSITIHWESGASLAQPFCPANGCIQAIGWNYIIFDGGTNGIIQSTANGTGLANQVPSTGIGMNPCSNCEVKNLLIENLYVHTSVSDVTVDQTLVRCMFVGGSNWTIHNNTMHDAGFCVYAYYGNGDTNDSVHDNNIYNVDHGVIPNGFGAVSASNFYVYNNHIHDFANWDTTADMYHHDGVHAYGTGGANLTNLQIYDNQFDGNPGVNFSSFVYIEKPDSSTSLTGAIVVNNIIDGSLAPGGTFGMVAVGALTTGTQIDNNTIYGANLSGNYCILLNGGNTNIQNNVMSACQVFIFEYGAIPSVTLNNNTYAAIGSVGWQDSSSNQYHTLAAWQATTTHPDAASQLVASANLSAAYMPNSGSPVIGFGANLTSLGLSVLDSDKAGVARPTLGGWDDGAYQFSSVVTTPGSAINKNVIFTGNSRIQ